MLYKRNDTRNNIFGFAVSYLNSDLKAVNFLQKLKKSIKCIQAMFFSVLNDKKKTEFSQIQFSVQPSLVKKQDLRQRARASARCGFNPNIAILIG